MIRIIYCIHYMMVNLQRHLVIAVYLFKISNYGIYSKVTQKQEFVGFECYLNVSIHVLYFHFGVPVSLAVVVSALNVIETVGDKSTYVYTKRKPYYFVYWNMLLRIAKRNLIHKISEMFQF